MGDIFKNELQFTDFKDRVQWLAIGRGPSGSINGREFINQLSDYKLPKK
jgi:hypothetical protein